MQLFNIEKRRQNRSLAKKKKWSKEECRIRYVQGERITTRALAKMSNRSIGTIARWCAEGNWTEQRDQYVIKLRSKAEQKTIEKTSDRLSDEWAKVNEEHIKGSELFLKLSVQLTMAIGADFQQSKNKSKVAKDKDTYLSVQKYSSVYKEMVNLQRQALGMDYMDSNKAIAKVISDGYNVSEPAED